MDSIEQSADRGWKFIESSSIPDRFKKAATLVYNQLCNSVLPEDLTHAESTQKWVLLLKPEADEILRLAALSHDIERSRPNRLRREDFSNIDDYKNEHAIAGAEIASNLAQSVGYSAEEIARLRKLVASHEKGGTDPDIQLLTDADSLSFFENNLQYYLKRNSVGETHKKVKFM